MQPCPPWALKPIAVASSPESWMKSCAGRALQAHAVELGGSVLAALTFESSESRFIVSTEMSITERPGIL